MERDHGPGRAETDHGPAARGSLGGLVIAGALGGAVLAGVVGGACLAAYWISRAPEGARRALLWASLHGLLIGAAGLATGALSAVAVIARSPRLPSSARAAALGAALGATLGGGLGVLLWSEAAGQPVAVASLLANTLTGAALAVVARRVARR